MKTVKIAHIVAFDENNVIGKGDNDLPWDIKADMKHFRLTTTGYPVIMGRKTHFSIGRPLPNRKNIVVTRNPSLLKDVTGICSIDAAIQYALGYAEAQGLDKIFIIGGGEIYKATADVVDVVYATVVKGQHEGDRFYQLPKGFVQSECSGEQTDGVETYFFKQYVRTCNG